MRVLLVDDSATMRTIIRRSLESLGFTGTIEAADGLQAIEQFKAGGIDLILTDWNMPGKTGIDVAREVRTMNKTVPIIMVTTEAEKTRVLEAIQAGVSDYLVKPFTSEALQKKLERFAALV
jgi:two-component system chemotaxis response regulator CheY